MPYTAGLAADLSADRYGAVLSKHRHTRRFVRPIKETGKRPRPDRMGLGLFFCKVCRKIMPPGGVRVLKSAHHDAAVVFGGIIKSKRPRKKSRGRFCIIGRLSFVQPLSRLRRQGRVAAPGIRGASLASCWPLPQQRLPVSATGGGRRCCPLWGSCHACGVTERATYPAFSMHLRPSSVSSQS